MHDFLEDIQLIRISHEHRNYSEEHRIQLDGRNVYVS